MNTIKDLFFHLTPTTLAAIVADLAEDVAMNQACHQAMMAGTDNCGDEFWPLLDEARAKRDGYAQRAEDLSGSNGPVAAILARQS